jgi:hypothetical protein
MKGEKLDSDESPLLTDQQLRDAFPDQLEDLVQRINLVLQERGHPGLVWAHRPDIIPGDLMPGESPEHPATD